MSHLYVYQAFYMIFVQQHILIRFMRATILDRRVDSDRDISRCDANLHPDKKNTHIVEVVAQIAPTTNTIGMHM